MSASVHQTISRTCPKRLWWELTVCACGRSKCFLQLKDGSLNAIIVSLYYRELNWFLIEMEEVDGNGANKPSKNVCHPHALHCHCEVVIVIAQ